MKLHKKILYVLSLSICVCSTGCEKFLEKKSDQRLATPATLEDLQGLLDNYNTFNTVESGSGEASADNYYLEPVSFKAMNFEYNRRLHTWEPSYVFRTDNSANEWAADYKAIFYANTVLQAINKIDKNSNNASRWNDVAGQALFNRGQYELRAALLWTLAFDESTAQADQGIPLRLTDDFNIPTVRSNNLETYNQILSDLKRAVPLLPQKTIHVGRPSKQAAYGLLARTNLAMRRYKDAGLYADSCLQLYSKLIDYNTLNAAAAYPIKQFNDEVIWWNRIFGPQPIDNSIARINPELYNSYSSNDLRKKVFFVTNANGSYTFKGFYEGVQTPFGGVATDEVLLMRAECYARNGDTQLAMNDLNRLLRNRFVNTAANPYIDLTASSGAAALEVILKERRKQLLMRDLRWMDLKRLNKEGANITLQRSLDGKIYTLAPNDLRYAVAIPEDVIAMTGIEQNKR